MTDLWYLENGTLAFVESNPNDFPDRKTLTDRRTEGPSYVNLRRCRNFPSRVAETAERTKAKNADRQ